MTRIYWLINLLFISALAYITSDLFLTFMNAKLTPSPSLPSFSMGESAAKEESRPFSYYSIITERNLFNSNPESAIVKSAPAAPPPPPPPTKEEELPLTRLNLKLVGTVAGDPTYSYAFIEDRTKRRQDLYRVGDKIQEALIIDIARTRVILRNKGRDEVLLLYEDEKKLAELPQASTGPPGQARAATSSRRSLSGRGFREGVDEPETGKTMEDQTSPPAIATEKNVQNISREEINKNIENLNQFMTQVRLRPYFVEGKPEGFMISQIAQGSLLERVGLRSGDILKGVNGIPIDTPEKAFEVYQQLREESTIILDIERNNTPQTLTFNIQ